MIKPKQGEIDDRQLLDAAKLEIERAKGCFEDVDNMLRRAIAIQWLLDRNNCRTSSGLSEAIEEMIEELTYYHARLNDPGEESYDDLTQSTFLEHVQIEFCKEALEKSWSKAKEQSK
jgi:hypothetical protein